jgi:NAD(P)-dependent dehydrogenase (short-subunit alcohol dehydrogenase family)
MTAAGKVLVVTGGGRGIGAAVVQLAAAQGYRVAFSYLTRDDEARQLVADIRSRGGEALAVRADMGTADGVAALFAAVDDAFGRVDVLVNNAGIVGERGRLDELNPAAIRRVLDVNLVGTMLCCREAVRRMAPAHGGHGGAIVNVSSQAARFGGTLVAPYAAAKAGIETLTLALSREAAADGIRVNAVSPGLIATEANAGIDVAIDRTIPLGRRGDPREVAEAVLWLAAPAASYVTGVVLPVAGGR